MPRSDTKNFAALLGDGAIEQLSMWLCEHPEYVLESKNSVPVMGARAQKPSDSAYDQRMKVLAHALGYHSRPATRCAVWRPLKPAAYRCAELGVHV